MYLAVCTSFMDSLFTATTETLNIPLYRSEKRTFSLPLSDSPLTLVIPTVGSAILGRDCFCPLIIVDTLQCANLSTCTCFSDTNFTPSMMKICREEQSSTFISIAFQNLTVESNNSRLFFYYSSPPIMECTVLDREYIKSFEILQGSSVYNILFIVPMYITINIIKMQCYLKYLLWIFK